MPDQKQSCVIVGAGHGAAQIVASLRQEGWTNEIVLVGEEPYLPYNRPPLSKSFLSGEKNIEDLLIRGANTYDKAEVITVLGKRVVKILVHEKAVLLDDGSKIPYTKLALMTGGKVRKLTIPGAELTGVHYLRNIDDVTSIRDDAVSAKKAVIIGGGYIGLEAAAMLRQLGMEVCVLEAEERLLARVTAPEVSVFFSRVHAEEGVEIITSTKVVELIGNGRVEGVVSDSGTVFPADIVIVGIGIIPETELAENAGLTVENGIAINAQCQTSDPDIVAAGDCASFYHPLYQKNLRLESVQNAVDQAKIAAATVCGQVKEYSALPWFWSDQYDLKLQIAGLSTDYDQVVVRGTAEEGRKFSAFYLKAGKILAVDAINNPQDFMFGKRLIQMNQVVDIKMLADLDVPLKSLL